MRFACWLGRAAPGGGIDATALPGRVLLLWPPDTAAQDRRCRWGRIVAL